MNRAVIKAVEPDVISLAVLEKGLRVGYTDFTQHSGLGNKRERLVLMRCVDTLQVGTMHITFCQSIPARILLRTIG
jgi:hypothetical protein